jgi:hypothetical protein
MIVFITHCWRSARHAHEQGWVLALLLLGLAGPAVAGVEIEQLRAERQDAALVLHAHLKLDLEPVVVDALMKGVAIHFVAEAELVRERWYWYDRKVAQASRYYRLAYQPLTRQWRLQVSSEPIAGAGQGTSIAQSFDSIEAALDVVRRQSGWQLAEGADVETDARQHVLYRFRLDMSQLPRPFQLAAGNQSGWNMGLSRTLRLVTEAGH